MRINSGTRVGPYEVLGSLGAGGMGEVYRARDTRLDRQVALKILPDAFASDPERMARFDREARLLAALNHPNIAAIHGVEESDGIRALVLEMVEGDTLAERMAAGPLPVDEALRIARQIAEAVDAAHGQGIIHRDLKPANIKVTPSGVVKVLDLGLAKLAESTAASASRSDVVSLSPTITSPAMMTGVGVLLGTAAYMPPEQARGRVADRRADVWAFGCVLYEMLTGQRAFDGSDVTDVLASVLKTDPDFTRLPAATPPHVRTVIERCLEKDPARRARDMGDVRLALDGAFASSLPATGMPVRRRRIQAASWGAGIVVVALLSGGLAWVAARRSAAPPGVERFTLVLPPDDLIPQGAGSLLSISPDGRTLAFRAIQKGVMRTFIRRLDQFEATAIGDAGTSDAPAFSPDGEWLAYGVGATLMKVPVTGGPSQKLADLPGPSRGLHWRTDGTILAAVPVAGIFAVPEQGGDVSVVASAPEGFQLWYPQALPGGRGMLITTSESRADAATIDVLLPGTSERRMLLAGAAGRYVASGHLLFVRGNALWAVPFDLDALEVRGTPVPVIDGVRVEGGGAVQYAVSDAGAVVYLPGAAGTTVRAFWLSRSGQEEPIDLQPREYRYPRVSPDGTRISLEARDDETDIWILTLGRRTPARLTVEPSVDFNAQWSADSRRIIFVSDRVRPVAVFEQSADGTGAARLLARHTGALTQPLLSADSAYLIARAQAGGNEDIVAVQLGDKPIVRPLVATRFRERNPELSRNGRWLAYQSNESGVDEVYVRPFPGVDTAVWPISENGGTRPLWSRDGHELFYLGADGWLMSVRVEETPTLSYGRPGRVVDLSRYPDALIGRNFDLSPDGSRFLVLRPDNPTQRAEINIVLNWFQELTQKVPGD